MYQQRLAAGLSGFIQQLILLSLPNICKTTYNKNLKVDSNDKVHCLHPLISITFLVLEAIWTGEMLRLPSYVELHLNLNFICKQSINTLGYMPE